MIDHRKGKPAHTDLRVLRRFDRCTLLEAQPHTGRTHQIRVHLAALDLPIVGDTLYAPADETLPIQRAALHAYSLRLLHPVDGREMIFQAPYPADFQ